VTISAEEPPSPDPAGAQEDVDAARLPVLIGNVPDRSFHEVEWTIRCRALVCSVLEHDAQIDRLHADAVVVARAQQAVREAVDRGREYHAAFALREWRDVSAATRE
jgi:hypothetical protein